MAPRGNVVPKILLKETDRNIAKLVLLKVAMTISDDLIFQEPVNLDLLTAMRDNDNQSTLGNYCYSSCIICTLAFC